MCVCFLLGCTGSAEGVTTALLTQVVHSTKSIATKSDSTQDLSGSTSSSKLDMIPLLVVANAIV